MEHNSHFTIPKDTISFNNHSARSLLSALTRTLYLAVKQSPIRMSIVFFIKIIQSLVPILQIYITEMIINELTLLIQHGPSYLKQAFLWLLVQFGLMIFGVCANYSTGVLSIQVQYKVKYHIDKMLSSKVPKIPYLLFSQPEFYNLFQRASGQSTFASMLADQLMQILQSLLTLTSYVIVLYHINSVLSLGLILLTLPVIATNIVMGKARYSLVRFQTNTLRKVKYLFDILTGKDYAKELRIFGYDQVLSLRWSNLFWKAAREQITFQKKSSLVQGSVGIMDDLVIVFILGILFWLGSMGKITLGLYVSISQAFTTANGQMHSLARSIARVHESSLNLADLFVFLDLEEGPFHPRSTYFPRPLQEGIKVENITFVYPNTSIASLQNVSFFIKKGQTVAIVGENGSGKSTLINCLTGLYVPQDGNIYFDGIEYRNIDMKSLRDNITIMFQDFVRYQLSLYENIGIGMPENINDISKIEQASKLAGIHFVDQLSNGYDTVLGTSFEKGQGLSGGQWQRVAMGRALFRDAQVLILDEPTSTFDPISERIFCEEFLKSKRGQTTIVITHRLEMCQHVDQILVLKNGTIIEGGDHITLLNHDGEYAKMYGRQIMNGTVLSKAL